MKQAHPPHLDPAISSIHPSANLPLPNQSFSPLTPPRKLQRLQSHPQPEPSQEQYRPLVPFSDFLTQPSSNIQSSSSQSQSIETDSSHPSPLAPVAPQQETEHDEDDLGEENVFRDMSFDDILEDLNARFLVNLPEEEMNLVRLYWQAEQAHWFYEDYIRPLNPLLPSLSQRQFTHLIIASSPLYSSSSFLGSGEIDYDAVWEEYCAYKKMVPCCGAIIISAEGDKCLMVRGWKSNAGWCFPRGKINSEESEVDCAIREVEEETGFDLTGRIVPTDCVKTQINAQEVTMFIVSGIDENTTFKTQTRKEIGAIEWVKFSDLPTWTNKRGPKRTGSKGQKKFYNVTPFVIPIKRYLKEHNIKSRRPQNTGGRELQPFQFDAPPSPTSAPSHVYNAPRASTALDQLFQKFVHKQEDEKPLGTDADGLSRLFGSLNVVKSQADAADLHHSGSREAGGGERVSSLASSQHGGHLIRDEVEREDDALTRLLGGVVTPQTDKQSKLLALLREQPRNLTPSPQPQLKSQHHASLLSMLSPSKPNTNMKLDQVDVQGLPHAPTSSTESPLNLTSTLVQKPVSLPTSPRPPSEDEDCDRRNRQRALLEMTIAGMGVDVPTHQNLPALSNKSSSTTNKSVIVPPPAITTQRTRGTLPPTQPAPQHNYRQSQTSTASSSTSPHLSPPLYSVVQSQGMTSTQSPTQIPATHEQSTSSSQNQSPLFKQEVGSANGSQLASPAQSTPIQPQPQGEHQRALLGALFGGRAPAPESDGQLPLPSHQPAPQILQSFQHPPPPPMQHQQAGYPSNVASLPIHNQPTMTQFQPPLPPNQPSYVSAPGQINQLQQQQPLPPPHQQPPQQQPQQAYSHRGLGPAHHHQPQPQHQASMHQPFPFAQAQAPPPIMPQQQWRPPNPIANLNISPGGVPSQGSYGWAPPPSNNQPYHSYQGNVNVNLPTGGAGHPLINTYSNPNPTYGTPGNSQSFPIAGGHQPHQPIPPPPLMHHQQSVIPPLPTHAASGGFPYQPPHPPQQQQGTYGINQQLQQPQQQPFSSNPGAGMVPQNQQSMSMPPMSKAMQQSQINGGGGGGGNGGSQNTGKRSPTKGNNNMVSSQPQAAVHQPVPRPPVGGGLLGLMSGR